MPFYDPTRNITPAFVDRVADWIASDSEVLVVVRDSGNRDFALCHSQAEFERIIALMSDRTEIIAVKGRHLPIRGLVDDDLISRASEAIADGEVFLVLSAATNPESGLATQVCELDTRIELEQVLRNNLGLEVALGVCPNYWIADHEGMMS